MIAMWITHDQPAALSGGLPIMYYTQIGVHPVPPHAAVPSRPPSRFRSAPQSSLRSIPLAKDNSFCYRPYYPQLIWNCIFSMSYSS